MISPSDILHGKVLIVDDQESNILLLERMLHGAGYVSVTSTLDPGEVCALHLENRYDLILLDLQMPGMDGFQVMEKLRECEPDNYLPVLVITAHPKAMDIITRGDGRTRPEHFDPDILAAFRRHQQTFRDIFEAYAG